MADSAKQPWSNNPNAPMIPYFVYFAEKLNFAGTFTSAIFYGIVVTLYFRCMAALLSPVDRTKRGIRWELVAYTTAMFSFVTVFVAADVNVQSLSYVDNREFPGGDGIPPGPLGYQLSVGSGPSAVDPTFLMYLLNQWLADGLLLYRCFVMYSMNYWVIAFPCLMFLGSMSLGISILYFESAKSYAAVHTANLNLGLPCYSISFALNVLLTLMIVIKLVLHDRNLRKATGTRATAGGVYEAIVTMLVESCALYAISFLMFIGPFGARSALQFLFLPILVEIQVIAPFLIILRVANRTAVTSESIANSVTAGSMRFRSQWSSVGGDGTVPVGNPVPVVVDSDGKAPGEVATVGVQMSITLQPDMV